MLMALGNPLTQRNQKNHLSLKNFRKKNCTSTNIHKKRKKNVAIEDSQSNTHTSENTVSRERKYHNQALADKNNPQDHISIKMELIHR